MTQQHSCGYYSGEAFIEVGRIANLAERNKAEAIDNHLSLMEKEIDNVALHCGIADISAEKTHLANMRTALANKQMDTIRSEAYNFEKSLIKKLASGHNEGGDPLDVIPTRMWDSLNGG